MKQFQSYAPKSHDVPSHVVDAGKIVLGAGIRMPARRLPSSGKSNSGRGADPRPMTEQKNA